MSDVNFLLRDEEEDDNDEDEEEEDDDEEEDEDPDDTEFSSLLSLSSFLSLSIFSLMETDFAFVERKFSLLIAFLP